MSDEISIFRTTHFKRERIFKSNCYGFNAHVTKCPDRAISIHCSIFGRRRVQISVSKPAIVI